LSELSYELTDTELADFYRLAMVLADSEKEITDRDLIAMIHKVRRGQAPPATDSESSTANAHDLR
jgi:hypothetical protein